jgi:hypothetical protein
VRCSAASRLALAGLLVLSSCGGSTPKKTEPGPPKVREALPPFQPLPLHATAVPSRGSVHTTFRIRIRTRAFAGVRAKARQDFELRMLNVTRPNGVGCIVDTGPAFVHSYRRPLTIVLNPGQQKGGLWCRGRFRGTLAYYRTFACPDEGVCRPPKNFPNRRRKVARLSFVVR